MGTSERANRFVETVRPQTEVYSPSDDELAARVSGGDRAAFEAIMRRHNRRLYRTARAILNDDAEAEEALQDGYLTAYRHIGEFRGDAKFSTWLTRILINEALQRRRRNRRHDVVVPFAGREPDEEPMTTTADAEAETPEHAALRADMRRLLEREIDGLPVAFRTVFILREVEDMSVEETAECLDLPAATVRSRLFRAKAQLREALAREVDVATAGAFDFAGARCERIVAGVLARFLEVDGSEPI